jgi:hypothetical protein
MTFAPALFMMSSFQRSVQYIANLRNFNWIEAAEFFNLTGWTTARTTRQMSAAAVLAARATICVAQFMKEPNHEEQLQAFGKLSSYQRSTFIEQGGWDKMPGEEQAGYAIARACADGLEVLLKK